MQYIPGFSKEGSELYDKYVTMFNEDSFANSITQVGEKVLESISQAGTSQFLANPD